MNDTDTLKLNVPGITCDGWVISIRMAVGQLRGMGQVDAEVKSRTLSVVYDSEKVSAEDIQQALVSIGYESTVRD